MGRGEGGGEGDRSLESTRLTKRRKQAVLVLVAGRARGWSGDNLSAASKLDSGGAIVAVQRIRPARRHLDQLPVFGANAVRNQRQVQRERELAERGDAESQPGDELKRLGAEQRRIGAKAHRAAGRTMQSGATAVK